MPQLFIPTTELPDLISPMAAALHDGLDLLWQVAGWSDCSPSFSMGNWPATINQRCTRLLTAAPGRSCTSLLVMPSRPLFKAAYLSKGAI